MLGMAWTRTSGRAVELTRVSRNLLVAVSSGRSREEHGCSQTAANAGSILGLGIHTIQPATGKEEKSHSYHSGRYHF